MKNEASSAPEQDSASLLGSVDLTPRINEYIAGLRSVPPAFDLIPRLLLLLDDSDANGDALADVIRVDVGLTATVLHMSNNAAFAGAQRIGSLQEAILRLGLREIFRIVMKVVASPVLGNAEQAQFARLDLWKHSLTVAIAAQVLATATGNTDPEVAFTAGLLHDIGKVVIAQVTGPAYITLIEECVAGNKALFMLEKRAFRTDHAEIGAKLLKRWNFPDSIVAAIAAHHDPAGKAHTHARLAALIYFGNVLAYRVGSGRGFPDYVVAPDVACLQLAGLNDEALSSYEDQVKLALDREQARLS